MTSASDTSQKTAARLRQLAILLTVFAAGFGSALWIATPPVTEARGGEMPFDEMLEIEPGRYGLHLESQSKDIFLIATTWQEGIPESHPIPPGGGIGLPVDQEEEWGLYEIRFRPCRWGNCTDPIPPPDLFGMNGVVEWDRTADKSVFCNTCELKKCCPKERDNR